MDQTLFLFLEILAFLTFFYSLNQSNYERVFIFLSVALFLPLSFAALDIEQTQIAYAGIPGELTAFTHSSQDYMLAYLNAVMGLLAIGIGLLTITAIRNENNPNEG